MEELDEKEQEQIEQILRQKKMNCRNKIWPTMVIFHFFLFDFLFSMKNYKLFFFEHFLKIFTDSIFLIDYFSQKQLEIQAKYILNTNNKKNIRNFVLKIEFSHFNFELYIFVCANIESHFEYSFQT